MYTLSGRQVPVGAVHTLRDAEKHGPPGKLIRVIHLEPIKAHNNCEKCGYPRNRHNNGGHEFVPKE